MLEISKSEELLAYWKKRYSQKYPCKFVTCIAWEPLKLVFYIFDKQGEWFIAKECIQELGLPRHTFTYKSGLRMLLWRLQELSVITYETSNKGGKGGPSKKTLKIKANFTEEFKTFVTEQYGEFNKENIAKCLTSFQWWLFAFASLIRHSTMVPGKILEAYVDTPKGTVGEGFVSKQVYLPDYIEYLMGYKLIHYNPFANMLLWELFPELRDLPFPARNYLASLMFLVVIKILSEKMKSKQTLERMLETIKKKCEEKLFEIGILLDRDTPIILRAFDFRELQEELLDKTEAILKNEEDEEVKEIRELVNKYCQRLHIKANSLREKIRSFLKVETYNRRLAYEVSEFLNGQETLRLLYSEPDVFLEELGIRIRFLAGKLKVNTQFPIRLLESLRRYICYDNSGISQQIFFGLNYVYQETNISPYEELVEKVSSGKIYKPIGFVINFCAELAEAPEETTSITLGRPFTAYLGNWFREYIRGQKWVKKFCSAVGLDFLDFFVNHKNRKMVQKVMVLKESLSYA